MPQIIVGCDLSRAFIDFCPDAGRTTSRIENTKFGVAAWADRLDPSTLVVFEATSGCDGLLMEALATRGIPTLASIPDRPANSPARWASSPKSIGSTPAADHHGAAGSSKTASRQFP